jgi:hypothetical protein
MSLTAPDPSPVTIHYATVFKYGAPVLGGSKAMTTPAAADPRYVSCPECLARMSECQREARVEQVRRWG